MITGQDPIPSAPPAAAPLAAPEFDRVYDEHFAFVWRNLRRLGVAEAQLDDAVQEVFLVVYRRLADFAGRSLLKTWVFGIVVRVAADQRRALRRKSPHLARAGARTDAAELPDASGDDPHDRLLQREGSRLLHEVLERMSDDRRAVFVLAELEQMPVPEIAAALGLNVNTAYARLRAARHDFEQAVARLQARDGWRLP
jgi:RNA polymerase sigma-70 factor (ECF subfamily)